MEKRYQVFISSTFSDLKDERQSVLRAILELDHMPAGMELFPAADDSAWQLIKDVIDASDYYVVIVGGRYGSLDEKGIGYTEKEYSYAIETGKPVLALLHEKPDALPREKTETDEAAWKKLEAFRNKIERRHHCDYWRSSEDLKAKVIVGITKETKRHPAVGWIRADRVPSEATIANVLSLRTKIAELERQLAADASRPPRGAEDLVQGDERFEIPFTFIARIHGDYGGEGDLEFDATIEPSWNELFAAVAPIMIQEASETAVKTAITRLFLIEGREALDQDNDDDLKDKELRNFTFDPKYTETILIQFRALGLIEQSVRSRSVRDTKTYWRLTKHGDALMTNLRAIRRGSQPDQVQAEIVDVVTGLEDAVAEPDVEET